jgi:hypothetical protein
MLCVELLMNREHIFPFLIWSEASLQMITRQHDKTR